MSEQTNKGGSNTPRVIVKGAGRYAPPDPVTPPVREAEPKREEQDHG